HESGVVFPVGTTTVTYTATDAAGNTTTCSFDVIVIEAQAPAIACCPADIELAIDIYECGAVAIWTAPTADDNCAVASFSSNHETSDERRVGTSTVTFSSSDADRNTTTYTDITTFTQAYASANSSLPSQT